MGFTQIEQPKTETIGLLWMRLSVQHLIDDFSRCRADIGSPVEQASRRPLLMLMVTRHVLWLSAVSTLPLAAWMLSDQVTLVVDLHLTVGGFQLDMVANQLMGNRVVVTAIFDVIIRPNLGSSRFVSFRYRGIAAWAAALMKIYRVCRTALCVSRHTVSSHVGLTHPSALG